MTSNYQLKQDCKATLNSIRDLLPKEERQKVEPLLRQILEVTKSLMENAKVTPEDHEALAAQVGTLTKERTQLSETIIALSRDLQKAARLKDEHATLESEKDYLECLVTDTVLRSLRRCAASGIGLITHFGDTEVTKWIAEQWEADEGDVIERRALLAVCLTVSSMCVTEEAIDDLLSAFCVMTTPHGSNHRSDAFMSMLKAKLQSKSPSDSDEGDWWWLALNGASCAANSVPAQAAHLNVSPVPEQLIGFRTREEQLEVQKFLLTAPIADVQQYLATLPEKIESGEVAYVRPRNPEPPTHGPTSWHINRHSDC